MKNSAGINKVITVVKPHLNEIIKITNKSIYLL